MRHLLVLLVLLAACGDSGDGTGAGGSGSGPGATSTSTSTGTPTSSSTTGVGGAGGEAPVTVTETVGPAGGTVATSDGVVLDIPAGALPSDTTITITRVPNPIGTGTVSAVYDLSPDGLQFDAPVALTIPYDAAILSGPASELAIAWTDGVANYTGAGWTQVDGQAATATAFITHFSQWAVVPASPNGCATPTASGRRR